MRMPPMLVPMNLASLLITRMVITVGSASTVAGAALAMAASAIPKLNAWIAPRLHATLAGDLV
jgi:hypothetical protein